MAKHSNKKVKNNDILAEAIIETEERSIITILPKNFQKHLASLLNNKRLFIGGSALVIATFVANILNYLFNTYLSRVLSFEDFSLIGLIGSFFSLASILFGAYATTVNYRSSFLIGKYGEAAGYTFWKYMTKKVLAPSVLLMGIWLLITPFLLTFFHTDNLSLFLLFGGVLLIGFISYVNQGFLASRMLFGSLAIVSITDPLVKLATVAILVYFGQKVFSFSAIPLAAFAVFISSLLLIKKQTPKEKTVAPVSEVKKYSKKFFSISLLSGFSSVAFFTFDIFLAKHFLTATQAGEYTLVSLVGKMIFFLGNLTSPFVIPLISRYEGANKNSLHALYVLLACTSLFALTGFILFGVFGTITVPILYGHKAESIVSYLFFYTFGMTCYTISSVLVNYYLVRRVYTFTIATSLLIFLQIGLILFFHESVKAITIDMAVVLLMHLLVTVILHIKAKQIKTFEKYFISVIPSFIPNFGRISLAANKKK